MTSLRSLSSARFVWGLWAVGCLMIAATSCVASDWPQWLGPGQTSEWVEEGVLDKFPEAGLNVQWRVPVGLGYSGPAVVGDRVFLTDYIRSEGAVANNPGARISLQGTERVLCFSAADGKLLWKQEYDRPYEISYPSGPRATPTVDGEMVYALGAEGDLLALKVADGSIVWKKQLQQEYAVKSPIWGYSAAPLVQGDRLYCMVGGKGQAIVAFDKKTGKELWKAVDSQDAGYAMPTIIEAAGVSQLIVWAPETIQGLNPENGEVYWTQPLKPDYGMSIMVPRYFNGALFASGIGNVGKLFRLGTDRPSAEIVWAGDVKSAVYCANSTPVIHEGIIYGCDCRSGALVAVEMKDGQRLWESFAPTTGERRAGHGTAFLVRHEDRYFLFSETGELILAKLSREGYVEISRARLLEPTNEAFNRPVVWTHPAFADKSVFARNDKELVRASLAK
ncbi:MAG: PQQ-binding-like beta-propeller repeat protein [Planctomycetaceae bacterium]